jgi:glycosyltransferase involved in cell wall biosynthesis
MKVVLAVKSLFASYGGPAFSVSRLGLALANAGVEVGLWAGDMSAATSPLVPAHRLVHPMVGSIADTMDRFGRPDIVHDNGIWLAHNHRLAEFAARRNLVRVVSTRGMLEPWAMNHKRLKKRLAWWLYQRRDLCRASFHHTTAVAEAENLKRLELGVPTGVIPNGVDIANVDHHQGSRSETKTVLFLGRIHPVKGLSLLLEAWARLRPPGWQLQIAGPDEIGYRAELERAISTASLSAAVRFIGSLEGEAKERAYMQADLFVLPSFSESFGMAVGEALAHGVPVLTTTGAPWPMIARQGCGWSVPPTVEGITEGLREATSRDPATLVVMGERGRELVRKDFAWASVASKFITTYETLLKHKTQATLQDPLGQY